MYVCFTPNNFNISSLLHCVRYDALTVLICVSGVACNICCELWSKPNADGIVDNDGLLGTKYTGRDHLYARTHTHTHAARDVQFVR